MGKLLSRTAAAKLLGCNPQTITNYVRYGLIDEVHRELRGRDGFYYDSEQLAALAPHLTELSELEARISEKKGALQNEEKKVDEARENARREFIRFAGGSKTWKKVHELIVGAYAFAGKVNPSWASYFDAKVLEHILDLEDFDTICAALKTTPYKVSAAVSRIVRRMLKAKTMEVRLDETMSYLERVWADNRRLQKAYELQLAMGDVRAMTSSSALGGEVMELARKLYPLKKMHVGTLGFSPRAESALREMGIHTLFELVGVSERELRMGKGVGQKTLEEIRQRLSEMGLSLGMHEMNPGSLGFDYIRQAGVFDSE